MSPNIYHHSLKQRGFVRQSDGSWTGPWGIVIPGTWNDITTTSLADRARDEVIKQVDQTIAVKRRDYNAK
ncbi:MAG: hypothetical protein AB7L09_01235 [Nitrospira sp.]